LVWTKGQLSQAFKDCIWIQLSLNYIVKQICNKHKATWWARANVKETKMKDDFIKQQDIAYLDFKHKRRSWYLIFRQKPTISLHIWRFNHPYDVFYFQDMDKVNGIHVTFTIGIQTPSQSLVSLGNNGVISMDATFSIIGMKFHLFMLMVFDAHHIKVLVTWIIISHQTCNDLVESLTPLNLQSLKRTCIGGNLHVSSFMMIHKTCEHCGESYFHPTLFFIRPYVYATMLKPYVSFSMCKRCC